MAAAKSFSKTKILSLVWRQNWEVNESCFFRSGVGGRRLLRGPPEAPPCSSMRAALDRFNLGHLLHHL